MTNNFRGGRTGAGMKGNLFSGSRNDNISIADRQTSSGNHPGSAVHSSHWPHVPILHLKCGELKSTCAIKYTWDLKGSINKIYLINLLVTACLNNFWISWAKQVIKINFTIVVFYFFNIPTGQLKITYKAHNVLLLDSAHLEQLVHWAGGEIQDDNLVQSV